MKKELKQKIYSILCPQAQGIFSENDVITTEIIDFVSKQKTENKFIRQLFLPPKDKKRRHQLIERVCADCGKKQIVDCSATDTLNILTHPERNQYHCDKCENRKTEQQKIDRQKICEETTLKYIDSFLNPSNSWKADTRTWEKIAYLRQNFVDFDVVASYIRDMNYCDFLNTPYWKAIAEKVKVNNGWCCEMCGIKTQTLNIHHPNYEFHGYELQNIGKLKCLCFDCHNKFHNKGV